MYQLPYTIIQRPDGLWTVHDATGREVEGIASVHRKNAENFVRAIEAWRANPPPADGRGVYIHVTPKE